MSRLLKKGSPLMTGLGQCYQVYDFVLRHINLPAQYCSKCERKVRYWVYHFKGLVHCQECADQHVVDLYVQTHLNRLNL